MITHHTGHVLDIVRQLPDASVDAVIGSPPFLALRNYNDLPDQWGSEPTPAAFLAHLLELTTELRRVLAPHGSLCFELGDTYSGSGGAGGDYNEQGWRNGQPRFRGSTAAASGPSRWSTSDAHWLGALIDAEGAIFVHWDKRDDKARFTPVLAIAMNQRAMLDRAATVTGVGRINPSGRGFKWQVSAQQCRYVLLNVWPYLMLKQERAWAAIELARRAEELRYGNGNPIPDAEVELRAEIRSFIMGENEKGGNHGTYSGSWRPPRPHRIDHGTIGGSAWPLPKSLTGTPTLFAWSLAYGRNLLDPAQTVEPWLVRNVIVWARNNPPVGALGDKVRPAVSYITVATPSPRRWFDLDAVRTPPSSGTPGAMLAPSRSVIGYSGVNKPGRPGASEQPHLVSNPAGAPPLDHWHDQPDGDLLWLINTQGSNLSHYAMWPPALAERLILSMCPAQVCRVCGEPRRRLTSDRERFTSVQPDIAAHIRACRERAGLTSDELNQRLGYREIAKNWERTDRHGAAIPNPDDWLKLKELIGVGDDFDAVVLGDRRWHQDHAEYVDSSGAVVPPVPRVPGNYMGSGSHGKKDSGSTRVATTIGWSDCGHDNYRPGVTLDPFAGTGTTLAAADINGRDAIGIDLDPVNAALHATRWAQCWRALRPDAGPSPITAEGEQLGLLL